MKRYNFSFARVTSILSFLFTGLICFLSIQWIAQGNEPFSLIPYSQYLIPTIHGFCFIITIILFFKPFFPLQFLIFQIESIVSLLTKFEGIGIFLFYSSIFLFLCKVFDNKKHIKSKFILSISLLLHIISLFILLINDIRNGIIFTMFSFFVFIIFMQFYEILKVKFSCFKPAEINEKSKLSTIKQGSILHLRDYNLTERQILLVKDNLSQNMSYKELSNKYNMSLSLVKKEFTDVFKIFGVSKLVELHILLLQYQVKE